MKYKTYTRVKRGGIRLRCVFNFNDAKLLGVGGFGIALSHIPHNAVKLLYDINQCNELIAEARIQMKARKLLEGVVNVPRISSVITEPVIWKGTQYLCGIAMERIPLIDGYNEPMHIILGDDDPLLNSSWGKEIGKPVGPNNLSRGFFASGDFLEDLWESESSEHTIESVSFTMGRSLKLLIEGGIIPVDLEWIYGGDGKIYLIDYGLCRLGSVVPRSFFFQKGREGIASEIYVPHEGDLGYAEFVQGYFMESA